MDVRDLRYGDQSFDVVLFDPPHMADAGEDSVLGERFGSYSNDELKDVGASRARATLWRVSYLGVVIKVSDTVHNQVFVSMTEWVRDVRSTNDGSSWPTSLAEQDADQTVFVDPNVAPATVVGDQQRQQLHDRQSAWLHRSMR